MSADDGVCDLLAVCTVLVPLAAVGGDGLPVAGDEAPCPLAVCALVDLDELRGDGTAVILTTHLLDDAQRLADQVVIVDEGQVRACGSVQELIDGDGRSEMMMKTAPGTKTTRAPSSTTAMPAFSRSAATGASRSL